MVLLGNQMVKMQDGSMKKLEDLGGGDVSELTERVDALELSVNGIAETVGGLSSSIETINSTLADMEDDIEDVDDYVTGIKNYLNSPPYSEQVLCYAGGTSERTKVTNPGRIAYVYEIDKTSGKKVLSSNLFFVKNGYIGNSDVTIQMTKGTVIASLYGNPDNMFTFQVSSSDEPENLNIVYLCGTIARI